MTTLKRRRYLALALMLALLLLTTPRGFEAPLPELPPAVEVMGSGPVSALACAGCVAGGVAIAMGGWGSILAAAASSGSALGVLGCATVCYRAIRR